MINPDINTDELVLQKEIDFKLEDQPAMNFKTGQVEMFSIFHYDVKLFKKKDGQHYYLFKVHDDCTLYIMNCNKLVYDLLEKHFIPIKDVPIFEYSPNEKGKATEFVPIPDEYRNQPGAAQTSVIFTD